MQIFRYNNFELWWKEKVDSHLFFLVENVEKYMVQIVFFNFSYQEKLVTNKSFKNVNQFLSPNHNILNIFRKSPVKSSLIYLINNCPNYWYDLSSETDIQMWQKMCLFFFFCKIVQCASAAAAPVTQLLLRITMDLTQSETTS